MTGFVINIILITTLEKLEATALAVAITFFAAILTFSFSLQFYER